MNKQGVYQLGTIVEIKERYNRFPYTDIFIQPEGSFYKNFRLSVPSSMREGGFLFELIVKLNAYVKEKLIGKKVYFKYYFKPNPEDSSHHYKIIDPKDVLTEEEYRLEFKIKKFLEDNNSFTVSKINKFFSNKDE